MLLRFTVLLLLLLLVLHVPWLISGCDRVRASEEMWGWLNSTERFAIELFVELRECGHGHGQCSTVQRRVEIEQEVRLGEARRRVRLQG